MSELLSINELYVKYVTDLETVNAVNGISLTLGKQETLGIVGETGAGKTTTALAIMRLLTKPVGKVTSGSITFGGEDLLAKKEIDMQAVRGKRISMIFQDPMTSLNPIISVGDQIRESLKLHNEAGRNDHELDTRVDEVLEMVGIPASRKNEYPHQFSGGMKQRVVIAIALACEPELLIADEPTSALDVTIQAQVLALMRELKDKLHTSMLMITHDLGIVAQICDRVAVMYAGEIIEESDVLTMFSATRHHPYTEGLFGSIPSMSRRSDRLTPIRGLMLDPTRLPEGCKFAPRCPDCMEICKTTSPGTYTENGHRINCFLMGGETNQ